MAITVHYKSTVTRSMGRYATCEKCGCQYTFSVTAEGEGRSRGAFGGRADAVDAALHNVQRKLLSEPAACPDCGWYQKPMVRELRRRHYGWMTVVAKGLLTLVGVEVALVVYSGMQYGPGTNPAGDVPAGVLFGVGLTLAAVAGVLLLVRSRLAAGYDPNRLWPQRPEPRPGEPVSTRTPEYQRRVEIREQGARVRGGLAALPWYYQTAGSQYGPVSLAELADLLNAGTLRPEDLAWADGLAEWVPVEDVLAAGE